MSDSTTSGFDRNALEGILHAANLIVPADRLDSLTEGAAGINALMRSLTDGTDLGEAPPANQFDASWE